MTFFKELKRRNVFRVGAGYVVTAWLLLQVVDLVLENINAPEWVMQVFMLGLAIGFPLAIFFAWAFEMTPEGLKKEKDVIRSQSIAPQTGRKLDRSIIIVLALALGYFAYDKFLHPVTESVPQAPSSTVPTVQKPVKPVVLPGSDPDEKSVAVLPFVNMSDDQENEYFSDGISEELLNVLVRVKGLRVPSRTSSFTFKGSNKKLSDIGRDLQVDHILEGSVRKSGDRIRVTAQLIEVNTDTHLWSETYTRKLDDIFAVQDEISQAIVNALKITLSGTEQTPIQSRSTGSVEAYNKYLLGRHLWNQRSTESLLAATEPLRAALEVDPAYGDAWAALADTYVLIPEYQGGSIKEYIPLAHEAIAKALAINPNSARALTTSAYIKFMYDFDHKGAHADFEKSIQIDPHYATARQWYAELLATENKLDASIEQLQVARQADPLAPIIPHVMAWLLQYSDRNDESYGYFEDSLELDPYFQSALGNLATLNLTNGRFDEARALFLEHAQVLLFDPATDLAVVDALENPALKDTAIKLVLQETRLPTGVMGKAFYMMLLQEPETALDLLEKAAEEGDPYAVHMKRMNVYDPIRNNPRFQALLAKMNMWP